MQAQICFLCFLDIWSLCNKPRALKLTKEYQAAQLQPSLPQQLLHWGDLTFSAIFFFRLVSIFLLPYDQPAISAHLEAMVLLLALPGPGLGG